MFAIIELSSGETVKLDDRDADGVDGSDPAIFETEDEAWAYARRRFGEVAGREYNVIDISKIP